MILSLGACRLYSEPTRIRNVCGLRRGGNGSRSGECAGEPREDAEVGVERDPLKSSDAKRREAVLVLQTAELAFDGGAATVEIAPAVVGNATRRRAR